MPSTDHNLARRLLEVIEHDIVPLTAKGVTEGNKLFGAAILRKSDHSVVIAGTNAATVNPLFHGEISTLNAYYTRVTPESEIPCVR
jgi:tRNA(Arg) A34 adenosine deaminase TadA